MAENNRNVITPRLVLGLVLIFVGVVFTLEHLDYVDADEILRYWPAILLVVGIGKVLLPGSPGGRLTGLLLAVVGIWLLAWELELTDYDPFDYWPLIFVVVGLRILWQGLAGRRSLPDADDVSTVSVLAVLGGVRRANHSRDFRGGDLAAFMGGCEIDLRAARIANPPAVIDAFAMWGGIDVIVPRDWHVVVKGWPFLAAFEDTTTGPGEEVLAADEPRQELVVKGFAIMGGVEIKN